MKKLLRILWIIVVLAWAFLVILKTTTRFSATPTTTLANPASVYCEQQSGTLEIVTDASGAQLGICHLADGTTCEEWAYFRGECPSTGNEVTWAVGNSWLTDSATTTNEVTVTPTEFSIRDSKYEVSLRWTTPLLSLFQDNDIWWSEFDDMVVDSDPQCKLLDQSSTKYLEKIAYYRALFSKYSQDDVVKIYLIIDKTLRDPWISTDEFEWEGMRIFVMPNKIWYTSLAGFEKDFAQNCEINTRIPTLLSSNYLIFFGGCGGWAGEPFGCKEIMNTIKDNIIVN